MQNALQNKWKDRNLRLREDEINVTKVSSGVEGKFLL